MTGRLTIFLTALLLASTPLWAQDDDDFSDFGDLDLAALLDAPVESASTNKESISNAPAVIEVITAADLKAWGVHNLDEALVRLPGIEVVENHWGYININIRGIVHPLFNNKVLLLVDHQPIYEVANMGFDPRIVPLNAIDRIEVIRGPGSVLFGTNAYAGVIHIFTRQQDRRGGEAELEGGLQLGKAGATELAGDGRIGSSLNWTGGQANLYAQVQKIPTYEVLIPGAHNPAATTPSEEFGRFSFPRGETGVSLWLNGRQEINEHHTLTFSGGFFYDKKRKWGFLPDLITQSNYNTTTNVTAYLGWEGNWENLQASLLLGYLRNEQLDQADRLTIRFGQASIAGRKGSDADSVTEMQSSRLSLIGKVNYQFETVSVQGGLDTFVHKFAQYTLHFVTGAQEVAPGIPLLDYGQFAVNISSWAQVSWRPVQRLSLLVGSRLDYYQAGKFRTDLEAPEPKATPAQRAALVYEVNEKLAVKVLYGHAFRLPSVFELFTDAPLVIHGSPDLKPETIDTVELVADAHPRENLSVRTNVFYSRTANQIGFRAEADGSDTYVNTDGHGLYGIEMTSRFLLQEWLDLHGSIGFQETCIWNKTLCPTGYVDYIAKVIGSASASFFLLDRSLALTPMVRYVGPRAGLGGALVWDSTVNWDPSEYWGIGLNVRNVFDKRFASPELQHRVTPSGVFDTPPRVIYLMARGKF